MQYPIAIIASVALFLALGSRERLEIRDSFEFEPTAQQVRKIRWPKKTIEVSLSTSLLAPGANIKADSDVRWRRAPRTCSLVQSDQHQLCRDLVFARLPSVRPMPATA